MLYKILVAMFLGMVLLACSKDPVSSTMPSSSSEVLSSSSLALPATVVRGFVGWDGSQFVDTAAQPLLLQGVAFGNEVWSASEPTWTHHTEEDFVRLKNMGMNVVRFYLSYKYFEDDEAPLQWKESGWQWLDSNVALARSHGVYLILNMHVPQGGFQSLGEGGDLWDIPANQQRLKALWASIAQRYARESAIAGYDLVNEPIVTEGKSQWQTLAQALLDTIRTVDTTHLVFAEKLLGTIQGTYANDAQMNFLDLVDPYQRTGITFHYYGPIEYTHQLAPWTSFGDGGVYPDTTLLQVGSAVWVTGIFNAPKVSIGNSDWQFYQTDAYEVTRDTIELGKPVLACRSVGEGTVWFDSLRIEEVDADGQLLRVIKQWDVESASGWWFWSQNNSGSSGLSKTEFKAGSASIYITGTTSDANLGSNGDRFLAQKGHYYRIGGYMKGENVPAGANCQIRLDFEHAQGPVLRRDKAALASEIDQHYAIAKARGVPVYLGEFGLYSVNFTEEKGGLQWVSDMIDILQERHIAFTYHTWHEDGFGIYKGPGSRPIDPSKANQELIQLFQEKLLN